MSEIFADKRKVPDKAIHLLHELFYEYKANRLEQVHAELMGITDILQMTEEDIRRLEKKRESLMTKENTEVFEELRRLQDCSHRLEEKFINRLLKEQSKKGESHEANGVHRG